MSPFPTTESTLSAFHLGTFLGEKYDLPDQVHCKLFRTGMNHLYMVNDGARKFVLRVYTYKWRSKVEIEEELRLLLHLKEQGNSVSYPVADAQGRYIQEIEAPEGLRYAVLFSFAEGGKSAKFTAEMSHKIGVAIAGIHKSAENFELKRIHYNADTLLKKSLTVTKSFFSKPSEEMAYVESLTNRLISEYEKVNTVKLRKGAVHMDMWFDNMHFNGEQIEIFDFDFCGNGWLVHDVAYFLYQLFLTNPDLRDYSSKAASFLQGYESITRLSEEESRIIPGTSLGVMLFFLSMQCDRYDTWSNIFLNEDHLKRFVGGLKRWEEFKLRPT